MKSGPDGEASRSTFQSPTRECTLVSCKTDDRLESRSHRDSGWEAGPTNDSCTTGEISMPITKDHAADNANPTSIRADVLILGAGRHAVEVIDALTACGTKIYGCLDARVPRGTEVFPDISVVGSDKDLAAMSADGFRTVYLGIGGLDNLDVRIRFFHQLEELGVVAPPLVHPAAHIAPSARVGHGTTVLARASIGPMTEIGRNGVITQNAVIAHHCRLGDHVVVAPSAVLAAGVTVGDEATIGMGVTIYHDLRIGRRALVVNGIDLMQDVPDDAVAKHHGAHAVVLPRT